MSNERTCLTTMIGSTPQKTPKEALKVLSDCPLSHPRLDTTAKAYLCRRVGATVQRRVSRRESFVRQKRHLASR